MPDLIKIEESLKEKLDKVIDKGIWSPYSAKMNRASEIGFNCDTFHALVRQKGHMRPRTSTGLAKVFRMGNLLETPNIRLVEDAGIKIKDRIGMYEWPEYEMRGKVDSWVEVPELMKDQLPWEHKTCSPNTFRAIKKHKDDGIPLTKSKFIWLRKYPGQLLIYMLFMGVDYGVWMFFNKVNGDYFFWIIKLDYDFGEELLQRAERCNENVAAGRIPKKEYKEECELCDFAMTYCFPDRDFGPGFDLVIDEDMESRVDRYQELGPLVGEYRELEKDLFGDKKKPGKFYGHNSIVGDHQIIAKEVESSWSKCSCKPEDKTKVPYKYFKHKVINLSAKKDGAE